MANDLIVPKKTKLSKAMLETMRWQEIKKQELRRLDALMFEEKEPLTIEKKMSKLLIMSALLMLQSCAGVVGTAVVYKGSQVVNHTFGGIDGLGLTEQCHIEGDDFTNSVEPYLYAVLLPADVVLTPLRTMSLNPKNWHFSLNHCTNWKDTATASNKVRDNYGGHNYIYMMGGDE